MKLLDENNQEIQLTPELEKQIKTLLPKKWEVWKPEMREIYWIVNHGCVFRSNWENDNVDNDRLSVGNCFQTKQEAERYKNKLPIFGLYNQAIELRDRLNDGEKGCWVIKICKGERIITHFLKCKNYKLHSFASEEIAKEFIDLFGEKNILRIYNEL